MDTKKVRIILKICGNTPVPYILSPAYTDREKALDKLEELESLSTDNIYVMQTLDLV
jgi:hypothetical protein